jgi:outer membrane biogenesis lipoprotein LolB
MTLRVLVSLAVLLLAACTTTGNSPQAACRSQANYDPQVRALRTSMVQNPSVALGSSGQLEYLIRQATIRCLQDKGLAVPGGVEPVMPQEP